MKRCIVCVLLFALLISVSACGSSMTVVPETTEQTEPYVERLSESCDYVFCKGEDTDGNIYELVVSIEESALGSEISAGIIKNNEWLYPLNPRFPLLKSNGRYYLGNGEDITDGNNHYLIAHTYFIDTGVIATYEDFGDLVILDCETMRIMEFEEDDYAVFFLRSDASFAGGYVDDYGRIYTDEGKIVMYSQSRVDGEYVYDWYILNTNTMIRSPIATGVKGVYPESVLSDGLFYASDGFFYNINAEKVIDVSVYDIDMWENSGIRFVDGVCTFEVENDRGSVFKVTIDKSGNVIGEEKIE